MIDAGRAVQRRRRSASRGYRRHVLFSRIASDRGRPGLLLRSRVRLASLGRRRGQRLPPPWLRFMGEDDARFLETGDMLADELERGAGLGPESSVLDLGCGYGRLAHALLRRGFAGRYLGIDVLPAQIDWCRGNLAGEGIEFRRVDVRNQRYNPGGERAPADLDLGGERFDVAAVFSVFTHMWPDDVAAYLRLLAAALRPAGRAVATFFLLDDEWRRREEAGTNRFPLPYERTEFCRYSSEEEPLHRVGYEIDWVRSAAREAGLAVAGPPRFGSWSGRVDSPTYQDTLVLARAGEDRVAAGG